MSELTFGDIFREFKKQYPDLNIDDWRPYGRNTITVCKFCKMANTTCKVGQNGLYYGTG